MAQGYHDNQIFKGKKFRTPEGVLGFCAFSTPFEDKQKGEIFTGKLRLTGSEKDEMISTLKDCMKADKKERKKLPQEPWKDELDEETGDPTGAIILTFNKKSNIVRKDGTVWERSVRCIDADGEVLADDVNIGAGSRVRVGFSISLTSYGSDNFLKLEPEAVKVFDLVQYGGGDGEGYFEGPDGDEDEEDF